MTAGPRSYGVAVERKLYRVARGTCYYPDCPRAIMFDLDDQPVCDVEIAHIRGAEPGSARYESLMTDAERAAFTNLILLCSAHHKIVDRNETTYPVELLEEWKASNEDDDLATLAGAGINAETLTAVLEEIAGRFGPRREIAVELACGLLRPTGDLMTVQDLATLDRLLAVNSDMRAWPRVFATSVRNTGSVSVEVEAVDLNFALIRADGTSPGEGSLKGHDDYPGQNPRLPHRLLDGGAQHWLTRFETVQYAIDVTALHDVTVPSLGAEVRLATGETITTEPLDVDGRARI